LLSLNRIWDAADHNAFTDLTRFQDAWYCTFREGENHVGTDGRVRVIRSDDGADWQSAALFEEAGVDLRDPKLSIAPGHRLMVVMGGSVYQGKDLVGRQPRVAFSGDGTEWTTPERILSNGHWLWRVTWHDGKAYGVSYLAPLAGQVGEWRLELVVSHNGVDFKPLTTFDIPDRPNETTLRFLEDGTMVALVRREAGTKHAWIGTSPAPYTDWTWNETDFQVGGPNFVVLPDGQWWAGSRLYTETREGRRTVLCTMTKDVLAPVLELPSGGDSSYPGFVWHDGLLWMSYYASHESKTSIYLAKIRLPKISIPR
jgi:hypothetical protein